MFKAKLLASVIAIAAVCAFNSTGFAATRCPFNGNYSFNFFDPAFNVAGVGYFTVQLDPRTKCRSGVVLPGGILNCYGSPDMIFEDFIEDGFVFLESDGEGTMEIETNSSNGICDTGTNAVELDISVVQAGKSVLFNTDGEEFASSGLIPQAGYFGTLTGRADKCFAGQISGCYDLRFFAPADSVVGDCTVCVNGAGGVTGGTCRCNTIGVSSPGGGFEFLSEIETGGYTLGENCQSSTGYLWLETSSDPICGVESAVAIDFAVAQQGKEILGACDTAEFILNNTSLRNAGFFDACSVEGFLQ